jgi:hypothetical protein
MTVYADYAYYTGTFLGTAIIESAFPQLAFRASAVIDQITFGRAAVDYAANTNVTAIKNATCAVAEELERQDAQGNVDGIASESQGQYSVSYLANSNRSKSNLEKQQAVAALWLANTTLMFAGFADDEYGTTLV